MVSEIRAEIQAELKADRFFSIFEETGNFEKLNALSIEDLKKLNAMVIEVISKKRENLSFDVKRTLKIGDIFETSSDGKTKGMIFEVVKLNPKFCLAKNQYGKLWNINYPAIKQ